MVSKLPSLSKLSESARISFKCFGRSLRMRIDGRRYAKITAGCNFSCPVFSHRSILMRHLDGVDMRLQRNKVVNLRIALAKLDGAVILPGETFSFWRFVGRPSRKKGYLPGLIIRDGSLTTAVGGGLCQMSNLLYWMFLHTPLTIVERHHHRLDLFPDDRRSVPFGTGTCLCYNFMDLTVCNETHSAFQLRLSIDDDYLRGEIRADWEQAFSYKVFETGHHFVQREDGAYRLNTIVRDTVVAATGMIVTSEILYKNDAPVLYPVKGISFGALGEPPLL